MNRRQRWIVALVILVIEILIGIAIYRPPESGALGPLVLYIVPAYAVALIVLHFLIAVFHSAIRKKRSIWWPLTLLNFIFWPLFISGYVLVVNHNTQKENRERTLQENDRIARETEQARRYMQWTMQRNYAPNQYIWEPVDSRYHITPAEDQDIYYSANPAQFLVNISIAAAAPPPPDIDTAAWLGLFADTWPLLPNGVDTLVQVAIANKRVRRSNGIVAYELSLKPGFNHSVQLGYDSYSAQYKIDFYLPDSTYFMVPGYR